MVGARVNGKLVPIEYRIQNGDRIEIITSQNSQGPSRDWLKLVKSTQAKNKINQWFKKELKEDNILKGKEMLAQYAKSKGFKFANYTKTQYLDAVLRKYGFRDWDSVLFAAIGHGGLKEGQVFNKLMEAYDKENQKNLTDEEVLEAAAAENQDKKHHIKSKSGIVVRGIHDVAVRFSKCCNPIPGDEIVGYVTRGRGVTIDCVNVMNMSEMDRSRLLKLSGRIRRSSRMSITWLRSMYMLIIVPVFWLIFPRSLQSVRLTSEILTAEQTSRRRPLFL